MFPGHIYFAHNLGIRNFIISCAQIYVSTVPISVALAIIWTKFYLSYFDVPTVWFLFKAMRRRSSWSMSWTRQQEDPTDPQPPSLECEFCLLPPLSEATPILESTHLSTCTHQVGPEIICSDQRRQVGVLAWGRWRLCKKSEGQNFSL